MQIGRVDLNQLRGVGDKSLGLAKELAGTLLDNERLQREGEAQQTRASEALQALRAELKAQAHDTKARVYEERQRVAQRRKEQSA
jgi:uncharacterized protein YjbJ (UPF0337 family)